MHLRRNVGHFSWSMKALFLGKWPRKRHDASPWRKEDQARAKQVGRDFGFFANLTQVRGDWAFYKALFSLGGWASKSMCWLCQANTTDTPWTDFSMSAAWRTARHGPMEFVSKIRQQGTAPSPLFGCPGFDMDLVAVDVLHSLDLGVSQDTLGNFFFAVLESDFLCNSRVNRKAKTDILFPTDEELLP